MKKLNLFLFFLLSTTFSMSQVYPGGSKLYRPQFHFAPNKNWINDPNGLVYFKGDYHLFFQYNPFGSRWGHMSWGHTTSKDLIKWKENTVALTEYKNLKGDTVMIFSGTAVIDSGNTARFSPNDKEVPLIALYTSNVINQGQLAQHQSLAYSFDGDVFQQYDHNPILDIHSKEFRDPKVFWYPATRQWIMIVSKPDLHRVQFYQSPDLKKWRYLSDFGSLGDTSRVWECPDIFQLPVAGCPGLYKWVITVSSGHPVRGFLAMQYFIGDFDGKKFIADPYHYPLYVDYGKDYYAGITYNNLPSGDQRKIMVAWANCWEYANNIPTTDYRGMMAIPRVLSLKKENDHCVLVQQPVKELNSYLGKCLFEKKRLSVQSRKIHLCSLENNVGVVEFTFRKSTVKAGIHILANGQERTTIFYDPFDNTLKLDRTQSGRVTFSQKFPSIESVSLSKEEKVRVKILIDKSLVEVFINGGVKVITDLVFPTHETSEINLFSETGNTHFENIRIQEIRPFIHS